MGIKIGEIETAWSLQVDEARVPQAKGKKKMHLQQYLNDEDPH